MGNHSSKGSGKVDLINFIGRKIFELASAFLIVIIVLVLYYSYMPLSYWNSYTSIRVLEKAKSGKELKFISYTQGSAELPIKWFDGVICSGPNFKMEELIKEAEFKGTTVSSDDLVVSKIWTWGVLNVPAGSLCYLKSVQELSFPLFITRTRTVLSVPFEVH